MDPSTICLSFKHSVNGGNGWSIARSAGPRQVGEIFHRSIASKQMKITYTNLTFRIQKISKGLEAAYPLSESSALDYLLQGAEAMLSLHVEAVGHKHAAIVWGFMSNFVMLDQFSAVLGAVGIYPGIPVPRNLCSPKYLGTGARVPYFPQSTSFF